MPLEVTFIPYFQENPLFKKNLAAKQNFWVASITNITFTCDVECFPISEKQILHFKAL